MIQIHPRISNETKRHLETIAAENNKSLNDVVEVAINSYISDYYSQSQEEKSLPRIEKMLDERLNDFSDSIHGMITSCLYNRPIHFYCFPDLTVSLTDPHVLKALTLNIKTYGYQVLEGVQP